MSSRGVSTGRVPVGRFTMVVGAPGGTRVAVARRASADPPPELAGALADGLAETDAGPDLLDVVADVEQVTTRIERAVELFTLVAQGRLDGAAVKQELDALLALLRRLDRGNRFEEALRLARGLHGLFALTLRWAALVEALQIAARAAEALADIDAQGWVAHELGSLLLGAEDAHGAEAQLERARELRERSGDRAGLRATNRNLATLRRATGDPRWSTRTLVLAGGAVLAAGVLAAAVVAPALDGGGSDDATTTGAGETTTTSGPTTTGTPPPPTGPDQVAPKPTLELTSPTRDGFLLGARPAFGGRAGTAAGDAASVRIELLAAGATAPAITATVRHDAGVYRHAFTEPVPSGSYTAVATQGDDAGNSGRSDPVELRVDADAPSVTITAPAPGTSIRAKLGPTRQPVHNVTITGTAGTEPGDEAVSLRIHAGATASGESLQTVEIPSAATWSQQVSLPFDPGGASTQYSAQAVQRDAAGNMATPATTSFTLTLPSPD